MLCACAGPVTCTNLFARNSPVEVTITLNSPLRTGARIADSAAEAALGHLYQAIGPPMRSPARSRKIERFREVDMSAGVRNDRTAVRYEPGSEDVSTFSRSRECAMRK